MKKFRCARPRFSDPSQVAKKAQALVQIAVVLVQHPPIGFGILLREHHHRPNLDSVVLFTRKIPSNISQFCSMDTTADSPETDNIVNDRPGSADESSNKPILVIVMVRGVSNSLRMGS